MLPLLICSKIWLTRNNIIFQGSLTQWPLITAKIVVAYQEIPEKTRTSTAQPHAPEIIDRTISWAYFDGAAQSHRCGGGFLLYLSDQHHYQIKMGLGEGTNNFAELITLRHLLHFALAHSCNNIQIFGDSKIIINWFNSINNCDAQSLRNILDEIMVYKAQFNSIIYQHIYKEHNEAADKLSEEATTQPRGLWMIQEQHGTDQYQYYHQPYIHRTYPQRDQTQNF